MFARIVVELLEVFGTADYKTDVYKCNEICLKLNHCCGLVVWMKRANSRQHYYVKTSAMC